MKVRLLPISSAQARFRRSTARIRGFCAGRGAGKTRIGAVDLVLSATDGDELMVVSPTYVVMAETTWPAVREVATQIGRLRGQRTTPFPQMTIATGDGGLARIAFRSGENPDSLRGPSKSALWLDEASLMPRAVLDCGLPVLRQRGRVGRLTVTLTPRGKRHWTYGLFYDEAGRPRPDTELIRAHTLDNPFLPTEYYELIRSQYTSQLTAQELAGEFIEPTGGLFKRDWLTVRDAPAEARRVRYWDKAATPGSGCYTVGLRMARTPAGVYVVEDVVRGQWSPAERNRVMRTTAELDAVAFGGTVEIHVEQEGGSGGRESADESVRLLAGFPVFRDVVATGRRDSVAAGERRPGEAKIRRALPLAAQAEAGNVAVVGAAWTAEFLDELCTFPDGPYADQVDAASGAFAKLAGTVSVDLAPTRLTLPPESSTGLVPGIGRARGFRR